MKSAQRRQLCRICLVSSRLLARRQRQQDDDFADETWAELYANAISFWVSGDVGGVVIVEESDQQHRQRERRACQDDDVSLWDGKNTKGITNELNCYTVDTTSVLRDMKQRSYTSGFSFLEPFSGGIAAFSS